MKMAQEMNPCPAPCCGWIDSFRLIRAAVSALWIVTESDPAETSVEFGGRTGSQRPGLPVGALPRKVPELALCKGTLQESIVVGPLELAVPLGDPLTATGARQSPMVLPKRTERFETSICW